MNSEIKILGTKSPQYYAVRRTVMAAQAALRVEYPDFQVEISEVRELAEIEKIKLVFIYPSLVVNDQLVCVGRFPKKSKILIWLQQALFGCA